MDPGREARDDSGGGAATLYILYNDAATMLYILYDVDEATP